MSGQYFPGVPKPRRRVPVVRLVLIGVLLALLVVFAVLWPHPRPGGLAVATTTASVRPGGVLRGTLAASRHGDRACYSMTVRGTTSVLRFVGDWSASEDLALVDPSGASVAQSQAQVILVGDPGAIGTVAGCPQKGRIWTISSVQLLNLS